MTRQSISHFWLDKYIYKLKKYDILFLRKRKFILQMLITYSYMQKERQMVVCIKRDPHLIADILLINNSVLLIYSLLLNIYNIKRTLLFKV